MPNNSAPRPAGPDPAEREFAETLRQAAFVFENEKNGRFQGSILACRAVARFIYERGGAAQLAVPFLQIAVAFEKLDRGGNPRLFAKKSVPKKERERSPERKHIHMLAAAALEVLLRLKADTKSNLANMIARHVNKWPGMEEQEVTGRTVIAWRNQQGRLSKEEQKPFDTVVEKILGEQNPSEEVKRLLRSGPPGHFKE